MFILMSLVLAGGLLFFCLPEASTRSRGCTSSTIKTMRNATLTASSEESSDDDLESSSLVGPLPACGAVSACTAQLVAPRAVTAAAAPFSRAASFVSYAGGRLTSAAAGPQRAVSASSAAATSTVILAAREVSPHKRKVFARPRAQPAAGSASVASTAPAARGAGSVSVASTAPLAPPAGSASIASTAPAAPAVASCSAEDTQAHHDVAPQPAPTDARPAAQERFGARPYVRPGGQLLDASRVSRSDFAGTEDEQDTGGTWPLVRRAGIVVPPPGRPQDVPTPSSTHASRPSSVSSVAVAPSVIIAAPPQATCSSPSMSLPSANSPHTPGPSYSPLPWGG